MDIEKYIEKEAPTKNETGRSKQHNEAYARALKQAYSAYGNCSLSALLAIQPKLKEQCKDSTHQQVANCMIVYELIEEKKRES